MTYSPPLTGTPTPVVLSTMTEDSANLCLWAGVSGASAVWPAANAAYFYPVQVARTRTYVRAWWLNGATAAGNVDVGVYTIAGTTATRVSTFSTGAIAQAGVSAMQVSGAISWTLTPGLYYLAMSCSLATATVWKTAPTSTAQRSMGIYQMTAGHVLPASGTIVASSSGHIPVFGLSELATI